MRRTNRRFAQGSDQVGALFSCCTHLRSRRKKVPQTAIPPRSIRPRMEPRWQPVPTPRVNQHRRTNRDLVRSRQSLLCLDGGIASWAKSLHCTCTICHIERCIGLELALPESHEIYRQIVGENLCSLAFQPSSIWCKRTWVQRRKRRSHFLRPDIRQLLSGPAAADHWSISKGLDPCFHTDSSCRRAACFPPLPFLAREDLSQVALITLIQCFRSRAWQAQRSHFGFAVARKLRRSLFQWAA